MYIQIKNFIDIFLSIIVLLVLSPVYILVTLIIYLTMGRPILFVQARVGLNERVFKIYKFRTMLIKKGEHEEDSSRITKFGNILRVTSLDELPGVLNVLKGEMSFIGPRPLLPEYLNSYSDREKIRHSVKPGLSGLAQVSGRNKLEWTEKLELDALYVEQMSFFNDVLIFFKTFFVLFNYKQVNYSSDKTMKNLKDERQDV